MQAHHPQAATGAAADTTHCPLCGGANGCAEAAARAAGVPAGPCWCMRTGIPAAVLARLPAAERGRACICARCAATPVSTPN